VITAAGWIKIAVLSFFLAMLYRHQLIRMVHTWMDDPDWSHGFLIPLFSLYFLHQRRDRLAQADFRTNWLGLALVVASIIGLMASIYPLKMGYPQQLAVLGTMLGLVLLNCGWSVLKIVWLPILYLFFAVPLPTRMYVALTMPMRQWASDVSALVLNMIPGIEAEAHGVVVEAFYQGQMHQLNVAEACAGMRLMMAFVALGVAMAYLSDRPTWHRLVLVASTLPIALFCNFTRVTVTGVLYIMVDPKYAEGTFHEALGLAMLPVAFLMYWGIAGLLNSLYIEEGIEETAIDE